MVVISICLFIWWIIVMNRSQMQHLVWAFRDLIYCALKSASFVDLVGRDLRNASLCMTWICNLYLLKKNSGGIQDSKGMGRGPLWKRASQHAWHVVLHIAVNTTIKGTISKFYIQNVFCFCQRKVMLSIACQVRKGFSTQCWLGFPRCFWLSWSNG